MFQLSNSTNTVGKYIDDRTCSTAIPAFGVDINASPSQPHKFNSCLPSHDLTDNDGGGMNASSSADVDYVFKKPLPVSNIKYNKVFSSKFRNTYQKKNEKKYESKKTDFLNVTDFKRIPQKDSSAFVRNFCQPNILCNKKSINAKCISSIKKHPSNLNKNTSTNLSVNLNNSQFPSCLRSCENISLTSKDDSKFDVKKNYCNLVQTQNLSEIDDMSKTEIIEQKTVHKPTKIAKTMNIGIESEYGVSTQVDLNDLEISITKNENKIMPDQLDELSEQKAGKLDKNSDALPNFDESSPELDVLNSPCYSSSLERNSIYNEDESFFPMDLIVGDENFFQDIDVMNELDEISSSFSCDALDENLFATCLKEVKSNLDKVSYEDLPHNLMDRDFCANDSITPLNNGLDRDELSIDFNTDTSMRIFDNLPSVKVTKTKQSFSVLKNKMKATNLSKYSASNTFPNLINAINNNSNNNSSTLEKTESKNNVSNLKSINNLINDVENKHNIDKIHFLDGKYFLSSKTEKSRSVIKQNDSLSHGDKPDNERNAAKMTCPSNYVENIENLLDKNHKSTITEDYKNNSIFEDQQPKNDDTLTNVSSQIVVEQSLKKNLILKPSNITDKIISDDNVEENKSEKVVIQKTINTFDNDDTESISNTIGSLPMNKKTSKNDLESYISVLNKFGTTVNVLNKEKEINSKSKITPNKNTENLSNFQSYHNLINCKINSDKNFEIDNSKQDINEIHGMSQKKCKDCELSICSNDLSFSSSKKPINSLSCFKSIYKEFPTEIYSQNLHNEVSILPKSSLCININERSSNVGINSTCTVSKEEPLALTNDSQKVPMNQMSHSSKDSLVVESGINGIKEKPNDSHLLKLIENSAFLSNSFFKKVDKERSLFFYNKQSISFMKTPNRTLPAEISETERILRPLQIEPFMNNVLIMSNTIVYNSKSILSNNEPRSLNLPKNSITFSHNNSVSKSTELHNQLINDQISLSSVDNTRYETNDKADYKSTIYTSLSKTVFSFSKGFEKVDKYDFCKSFYHESNADAESNITVTENEGNTLTYLQNVNFNDYELNLSNELVLRNMNSLNDNSIDESCTNTLRNSISSNNKKLENETLKVAKIKVIQPVPQKTVFVDEIAIKNSIICRNRVKRNNVKNFKNPLSLMKKNTFPRACKDKIKFA